MRINYSLLTIGAISVLFFAPVIALAQNPLVPCDGLDCGVDDLFLLLVNIYNFLLGLAAATVILMIVWGGIQMLIHYWSETPESDLEAAKYTIRRAVFGLIIILTAYLLVATLVYAILGVSPGGGVGNELQKRGIVAPPK